MNKRLEWLLLIMLAAGGIFLWCRLALPRYQSIDLSVSQTKAVDISKEYLKTQRGVDIKGYKTAVSFNVDEGTDRYLQKTLGVGASQRLIHNLHYDLFCWLVRFFKETQKEEFKVVVSSATGEVIGFKHLIEDTASRPLVDKDKARQSAFNFLKTTFTFSPAQYLSHAESSKKYDNRLDYTFSWQDKDVDIPWNKSREKGHAKLLTNVTVSGNEILSFDKFQFEIPDGFNRYVENLKQTGQNLSLVFRLLYLTLLTFAIVVVVNRKQQVVSRSVKPFYTAIGISIFVLMILDVLNGYQNLLFDYPTTQSLGDYIVRQFIESVIGPFFISVAFVLPALAGESIRYEITPLKKERSFLSALLSSFYSMNIARQIFIGYIAAAVVLGVQAFVFDLGFKYCGVWDELSWLTQASTSLMPAFTALAIGFQASFSEEAMFRLFAINLFKKYGAPTILAVFLSAAMWGFGHTGYAIFPMWFRGVEVTCIGIIMGIFYLRFGIVCVIAAHFLIDSFLVNLPYLLNPRASFDFYSALAVIALPLLLALIALIFKRGTPESPLRIRFNPQQQFNYRLLSELCANKTSEELTVLKKDLQRHGWDAAIIQRVFEEKI
jgi:Type II CAAX prenyl endopeptidase Rce1-like